MPQHGSNPGSFWMGKNCVFGASMGGGKRSHSCNHGKMMKDYLNFALEKKKKKLLANIFKKWKEQKNIRARSILMYQISHPPFLTINGSWLSDSSRASC